MELSANLTIVRTDEYIKLLEFRDKVLEDKTFTYYREYKDYHICNVDELLKELLENNDELRDIKRQLTEDNTYLKWDIKRLSDNNKRLERDLERHSSIRNEEDNNLTNDNPWYKKIFGKK